MIVIIILLSQNLIIVCSTAVQSLIKSLLEFISKSLYEFISKSFNLSHVIPYLMDGVTLSIKELQI
jgi:hypothetical protein